MLVPCVEVYGTTYLRADYGVLCDAPKHKALRGLAWMVFGVVPIGFPCVLLQQFYLLHRQGRLWTEVNESTRGAVRDDATGNHYVPNAESKRDYGFLYLSYEPSFWWSVHAA